MAPVGKGMGRTVSNKVTPENIKVAPENNKVTTNSITKKVLITDLKVEFLATKVDDYDVTNCFFKIIDSDCMANLKPLVSLNEDSGRSTGATAQIF